MLSVKSFLLMILTMYIFSNIEIFFKKDFNDNYFKSLIMENKKIYKNKTISQPLLISSVN